MHASRRLYRFMHVGNATQVDDSTPGSGPKTLSFPGGELPAFPDPVITVAMAGSASLFRPISFHSNFTAGGFQGLWRIDPLQ
jgi:hypothetical protein